MQKWRFGPESMNSRIGNKMRKKTNTQQEKKNKPLTMEIAITLQFVQLKKQVDLPAFLSLPAGPSQSFF